jgi:signal transduction histidine kinase
MTNPFETSHKKALWEDIHFWNIFAISSIVIIIYIFWPWRNYFFINGISSYFGWLGPLYKLAMFEVKINLIGSLFFVPMIYTCIVYKWKGSLIASVVLLIMLPWLTSYWAESSSRITNGLLLLSPMAVVIIIKIEIELRLKERRIFVERENEHKNYLIRILEAQERERQYLAEELHDESVQTLTALASHANSIELSDDFSILEIKKKVGWMRENILKTIEGLRRISIDLRPPVLDDMGLTSALKWVTKDIVRTRGIRVQLNIKGLDQNLNREIEDNIFRITQEALRNIEHHSKASEASIGIDANENYLNLSIQDNGQGFVLPGKYSNLMNQGKLGLVGIHERVKLLNGTFEVSSNPGKGTSLFIKIPLESRCNSEILPKL